MPDIKSLTAADLLRLYSKRELSPVDVTRDQLERQRGRAQSGEGL
jgi:hypothetical protein